MWCFTRQLAGPEAAAQHLQRWHPNPAVQHEPQRNSWGQRGVHARWHEPGRADIGQEKRRNRARVESGGYYVKRETIYVSKAV